MSITARLYTNDEYEMISLHKNEWMELSLGRLRVSLKLNGLKY